MLTFLQLCWGVSSLTPATLPSLYRKNKLNETPDRDSDNPSKGKVGQKQKKRYSLLLHHGAMCASTPIKLRRLLPSAASRHGGFCHCSFAFRMVSTILAQRAALSQLRLPQKFFFREGRARGVRVGPARDIVGFSTGFRHRHVSSWFVPALIWLC